MMAKIVQEWRVVYTNPRAEKKVTEELIKRGITVYFPQVKKLRVWSDRKKWVDMPLFNSYLFVCINPQEHDAVLAVQGVVKYIRYNGKPAVIREEAIDQIKRLLANEADLVVTNEEFAPGVRVRISAGPMIGLIGELVEIKSAHRFIIRLGELGQTILVNMPPAYIEKW
jgi:transcription antitermination factor NusG